MHSSVRQGECFLYQTAKDRTMHTLPFTPATDALGHTALLDQRASFPLLGVLVEIRSNSPAVIVAAERAFGGWRGLEPEVIEPGRLCVVNVVVHEEQRTKNKEQNDRDQEEQRTKNKE